MENEIFNKSYQKPREMFDDACLFIAHQLEGLGFKYSKSQATIKKKDKLFSYNISFYSSHYNYISENKGHVVMEFYCTIVHQKNIIFRVNQKELRSELHRFEIFDNETRTIDFNQIEEAIKFIKTHFIPVINEIQIDFNSFLEKMANQPIARFDDYGFKFEPKFFEIFNREDLIEKYESKIETFNNNVFADNMMRFKKYIPTRFDAKTIEEFNIDDLLELLKQSWASTDFTKFKQTSYEYYHNLFKELSKKNITGNTDWLTDYYIVLNACSSYIKHEKLKEQAFDILNKFLENLSKSQK